MSGERTDTTRTAPETPAGTGRIAWVDVAKGLCIILVVLHHAVMFLGLHGLVPAPVAALNLALTSLRMPLFFLASGLFVAAALERPWRVLLHRRVALFAWLYLLWTVVQFAVNTALPAGTAPEDATILTARELLLVPLIPDPAMWFLYALALFSVAARLLRRVPGPALLAVTGIASAVVGTGAIAFPSHAWELIARYAFFFVLGWQGRRLVEWLAEATSPLRVLAAGVLAAGAAGASVAFGANGFPGVGFGLNVIAVGCGVLLAAELARWRAGRMVAAVGRRTLPVYLANVPVMAVLTALLGRAHAAPPVQYGIVAAATAGTVTVTVALHRLLSAVRCGWFYDLPGRWKVRPAVG